MYGGQIEVCEDGTIYKILNNGEKKIIGSKVSGRYGLVTIPINERRKKHKVISIHRLVATAFIPNPNNLPQVNHKDGNPQNNDVSNLEWCTNQYNVIDAINRKKQKNATC